jgi:hypothetical protein
MRELSSIYSQSEYPTLMDLSHAFGGGDWMQEETAEGRGVFHDKAFELRIFFFVYLLCSDTSVKKIWGFLCGSTK